MPKGVYIRTTEHKRILKEVRNRPDVLEKLIKSRNLRKDKPMLGKHHTEDTKEKMRRSARNRKTPSYSFKKGHSVFKGSEKSWFKKGDKHLNWRGGITPAIELVRASPKYQRWRQTIVIRDDFTCQKCSRMGGKLHAHHIKPFSKLVQEAKDCMPLISLYDACMVYTPLWDIDNGITLCDKCHKRHGRSKK